MNFKLPQHLHPASYRRRLYIRYTCIFLSCLAVLLLTISHSRHSLPVRPILVEPHAAPSSWTPAQVRANFLKLRHTSLQQPTPTVHDVCLIIGRDPNTNILWRRNSRSLCVTSPVCISTNSSLPLIHSSSFSQTTCRLVTPAYAALPPPLDDPVLHQPSIWPCPELQHRLELCPWPNASNANPTPCIPEAPSTEIELHTLFKNAASSNALFEGITIVVPRYPFSASIFHFAATIATAAHTATNIRTIMAHYGEQKMQPSTALDTLPLNVLFLTQRRSKLPWQSALERILTSGRMAHALPRGLRVSYITEQKQSHVCVRNPVLMGQRGHVNVWPFPNATAVVTDGSAAPKDAVDFRTDVYDALGIQTSAITRDTRGAVQTIAPPPLIVAYARRAGRSSVIGMGVHAAGTVRRFSKLDETWFSAMLREETEKRNVKLQVFTTSANDTFEYQVRQMEQVGFVVGIHGANLANCIFMRPFGAIMEIFPAKMFSSCYIAGSNSGLRYFEHEAKVEATPQESGCAPDERLCWRLTRQRMVKISTTEDRRVIRKHVQDGIEHLIELNQNFPDGIPVEYDAISSTYSIVR